MKYVGISSLSESNVQRIKIEYLNENQLLLRQILVDYSNNQTAIESIVETSDKKPARNIRLSIRGCFGLQPQSTTTVAPRTSTTPSTLCHHLNLMSNQPVAHQVIAHIAGTNPISSSTSIAYAKSSPTFIIVFKRNIYVELKSISILNEQTNVRKYQIDFIDHDQTILQTIIIDK